MSSPALPNTVTPTGPMGGDTRRWAARRLRPHPDRALRGTLKIPTPSADPAVHMLAVDQRVFYRLPIELTVRFCTRAGDQLGSSRSGATVNLSAGGLLLRGPPPEEATVEGLLRGTHHLEVELELPTYGLLHALARVVWVERLDSGHVRMGVRFVDLTAEQRERVHAAVCLLKASSVPA